MEARGLPRNRQLVSIVEEDGDKSVLHVPQLQHPGGARVHGQVQMSGHSKVSAVLLKGCPVSSVEGLPLRGNIDKPSISCRNISQNLRHLPEGRIFPTLKYKICIWSQVASGEEELRALVSNVLVRQLLRPHQVYHRFSLGCHLVVIIHVEVVKVSCLSVLKGISVESQ